MRTNLRPGQTPLEPDEILGLKDLTITTKEALDAAEQLNVAAAQAWYAGGPVPAAAEIVSEPFLHHLHRQMFANVWEWAGEQRTTDKNIGGPYYRVAQELRQLYGDAQFWLDRGTFSADELALRFKHRLVAIHVYPNGNGRHSRLVADLLAEAQGGAPFSWGNKYEAEPGRQAYIHALRRADNGNYGALLEFARS